MRKGLGFKPRMTKKDNMGRMVDEEIDENEEQMLGMSHINDIHLDDKDEVHAKEKQ